MVRVEVKMHMHVKGLLSLRKLLEEAATKKKRRAGEDPRGGLSSPTSSLLRTLRESGARPEQITTSISVRQHQPHQEPIAHVVESSFLDEGGGVKGKTAPTAPGAATGLSTVVAENKKKSGAVSKTDKPGSAVLFKPAPPAAALVQRHGEVQHGNQKLLVHDERTKTASSAPTEAVEQDNPYLIASDRLPLSTRGSKIVDKNGNAVRLRCVNWSGAQLEQYSVGGLNVQKLETIVLAIRKLHFNCVRLVYSLDLFYEKHPVPFANHTLRANPELLTVTPKIPQPETDDLEIVKNHLPESLPPFRKSKYVLEPYQQLFFKTVEAITDQGLLIILNNHNSDAGWCCNEFDGNGFWYTKEYPTAIWVDHLRQITKDFKDNKLVVGIDLRNEIRDALDLTTEHPQWFSKNADVDWGTAALQGGLAVQKENADLLIVVGGVWYNTFLCEVDKLPIHKLLPNKVVYTSHTYSWFSHRLQVAQVLELYHLTLQSVMLVLWVAVVFAILLQRFCPEASVTRFFAVQFYKVGRALSSKREQDHQVEKMTERPPREAAPAPDRDEDEEKENVGHGGNINKPRANKTTTASRNKAPGDQDRSRGRVSAAMTMSHDPISIWLLVSTLAFTSLLVWSFFFTGRCSVHAEVGAIAFWILAIIAGVFSIVLFTLALLRFLLTDPEAQHHFRSVGGERSLSAAKMYQHYTTAGTANTSDGRRGAPPMGQKISEAALHQETGKNSTLQAPRGQNASKLSHVSSSSSSANSDNSNGNNNYKRLSPRDAFFSILIQVSVIVAVFCTCTAIVFTLVADSLQSYEGLKEEYDNYWGFLQRDNIAPVWVGEFGTHDAENVWFKNAMRYFEERDLSWSYWPLDGQKKARLSHDADTRSLAQEPFGLLQDDYTRIRDVGKMKALSPLLNLTTNSTTGDTYPPGFGEWSYPEGFGPRSSETRVHSAAP
ncbi:unnamed protein product [Amoebophrya sp. A120]|nr:unnamed protein product [Amoebophrya sp. A120]|eukprot:GSA120T00018247001.1